MNVARCSLKYSNFSRYLLRGLSVTKESSIFKDEREIRRQVHFVATANPKGEVTRYGGYYNAAMIPGHGVGPELCNYVEELFHIAGVPCNFERINVSPNESTAEELEELVTVIKRNGVAIKGNIETRNLDPSIISRDVYIRNALDLYVYLIHCKSFPAVKSRYKDINLFIVRQNIEGEYSNYEHEVVPGVVDSLKIITEKNSERLARFAFNFARGVGRKKVTIVHKANIMKKSDGLFLSVCKEVGKEFSDIEHHDMIIDNCCMQLVSNPQQFDVMVMPNLYGSIVANVACGLIGGPGLLSGCNYGHDFAVFESGTRNSGSAIAGKNMANPMSIFNASVDLLRHLDLNAHSKLIQSAIDHTLNTARIHTMDIGGISTQKEVVESIFGYLRSNPIKTFQH